MKVWLHYRDLITSYYDEAKLRRPQYSLRAYARDLGMTPSHLSDVLSSRRGISLQLASQIATALELGPEQRQMFLDLVESEDGRSLNDRRLATQRLERSRKSSSEEIKSNELEFLRHWFTPAILELVSVNKGDVSADAAAAAFGISLQSAELAIETLLKLGLMEETNSGYKRNREYNHIFSTEANAVLQSFHQALLHLASVRLTQIEPLKRQTLSSLVSFDSSRIEEARQYLANFHSEFIARFAVAKASDSVFVFNQNFFRADIGVQS